MIHRDCKEAVKQEYYRLHAKYPSIKSTRKLYFAKDFVRAAAIADTYSLLITWGVYNGYR